MFRFFNQYSYEFNSAEAEGFWAYPELTIEGGLQVSTFSALSPLTIDKPLYADFFGTPGDDTLVGTVDDDTFYPGTGNDTIDGGEGFDIVSYADATTRIQAILHSDAFFIGDTRVCQLNKY